MDRILFLCTGNYYRSRIAEAVCNHHCQEMGIAAQALSRGLGSQWPNPKNPGPISQTAKQFLSERRIDTERPDRMPLPCQPEDLHHATHIIGMSKCEHKPMFMAKFPDFPIIHVTFWEIGDVGVQAVQEAMADIYQYTLRFVTDLKHISKNIRS